MNYQEYGLNKKAFTSIQERWGRACALLEHEDAEGNLFMPDPKQSAKLINELENEVSSLRVMSIEERERTKNVMTDELREEIDRKSVV